MPRGEEALKLLAGIGAGMTQYARRTARAREFRHEAGPRRHKPDPPWTRRRGAPARGWSPRLPRPSILGAVRILPTPHESEAGVPVAEVIRKHGVSRATYSRRQAKHANAAVSELTRPCELQHEKA